MDEAAVRQLCSDLIDHLNWIGWGDAYERECSEELQNRANDFEKENNNG